MVISDVDNLNNISYIHSSLQTFGSHFENFLIPFITATLSNSVSNKQFQQTNRHESTQTDTRIDIGLDV